MDRKITSWIAAELARVRAVRNNIIASASVSLNERVGNK
jgi:hypothetical protein